MKKQRITTNLLSTLCLAFFFLFIGHITPSHAVVVDFEDLIVGDRYVLGDTFTTNGVDISVGDFQWGNSVWCSTVSGCGFAEVDEFQNSGGTGNDLGVNNVSVAFNFGSVNGLSLLYGEYGGNLNITINGEFKNFNAFSDIDGTTIGGVSISAIDLGGGLGTLILSGVVNSFSIGGQELWIDNVTTGNAARVMETELYINNHTFATGQRLSLVNKFDILVPVTTTIDLVMVIPDGTIVLLNSWPGIPFPVDTLTVPIFNYTFTGVEQHGNYTARITIRDFITGTVYALDEIDFIFP